MADLRKLVNWKSSLTRCGRLPANSGLLLNAPWSRKCKANGRAHSFRIPHFAGYLPFDFASGAACFADAWMVSSADFCISMVFTVI